MTVVVTLSHRLLSLIRFMGFLQVSIDEINVVSIMLKHLIRVEIECLFRMVDVKVLSVFHSVWGSRGVATVEIFSRVHTLEEDLRGSVL